MPLGKTLFPKGKGVSLGFAAVGRNAPELRPSCFGLVRVTWVYARAGYGAREMRRVGAA